MTKAEFQQLIEAFGERESALLGHKRAEYASEDGDVLENFKTLGALLHMTPAAVAVVYLAKHIQSISKQVSDGEFAWSWETPEGEGLKQRISDARNYLLLLAACLDEEDMDR